MDQPVMCKFLVENGADIDEIATDAEYADSKMYCAYEHLFSFCTHYRYIYHYSMDMLMPFSYLVHRCFNICLISSKMNTSYQI
jgi:hypothetical protein